MGENEAVTHKAPCREDTAFHTILGPRPFTLAQEKLACGGGEHLPEGEGRICKASQQEAHLGFVESRGGDEILERQSHLHFSLHLRQRASMVLFFP